MLTRYVKKRRTDDVRTIRADNIHKPRQRMRGPPLFQGFDAAFGEAEIGDRVVWRVAVPIHPHPQDIAGALHLTGSQRTQRRARFGADVVLAALAPGRTGIGQVDPIAKRQCRQHAGYFIVGMSAGLHEPDHGFQRPERPPQRHNARRRAVVVDPVLRGGRHHRALGWLTISGTKARLTTSAAAPKVAVMRPDFPRNNRGISLSGRLATDRAGRWRDARI